MEEKVLVYGCKSCRSLNESADLFSYYDNVAGLFKKGILRAAAE
jgi:hypothetical protein